MHAEPESINSALQLTLSRQRAAFLDALPVTVDLRRDRIDRGIAMVLAHRERLLDAVMLDFPTRPREWALLAEIFAPLEVFKAARKQLHRWMRPQRKPAPQPFRLFGARAEIQYQPLGVVGVMGAWNAPLNLVLVPMALALAAGNRVMLCPSDQMPNVGAALDAAVRDYFDDSEVSVAHGGLEVCKAFSMLAFDHLLFTGSPQVGAAVMAAAAPNLVPVTLELGGKCPVVVAPDADLNDAAQRIIASKVYNGGQACLAPDHLFIPHDQLEAFIAALQSAASRQIPGGSANTGYCGLASPRHFERLHSLVDQAQAMGARIAVLGEQPATVDDVNARRLALRVVIDPPVDSRALHEELFGPVFVLSTYRSLDDACRRLRSASKPLGLYVFSRSQQTRQHILDRSFSGGVTLNDVLFHYSVPDLPFGGVGRIGIGSYSFGIEGFRCFSHARSVYTQAGPASLMRVMQAPYGRLFDLVVRGTLKRLDRRYARWPRRHTG